MEVASLIKAFRSRVFDEVMPYLWSDEDVIQYLNESQTQYCREVRGIADASTLAITSVQSPAGKADLKLDSRILQIRSVYSTAQQRELRPMAEIDRRRRTQVAVPTEYTLDETDGYLSLDCTQVANDVLQLSVYRLPLEDVVSTGDELEVPAQHHLNLLAWMEHLAYLKPDVETYDKRKSDDAAMRFAAFSKDAKHELSRKRHVARSIKYGGL